MKVSFGRCRASYEYAHGDSTQDPLMVQLPIALAIEPRLLPYAEANGFHMDTKVTLYVNPSASNTEEFGSTATSSSVRCLKRWRSTIMTARMTSSEMYVSCDVLILGERMWFCHSRLSMLRPKHPFRDLVCSPGCF